MSITLTFVGDMPAGVRVDAFLPVLGLFVPLATAVVTPPLTAVFPTLQAQAGTLLAFAASQGGLPIWRSGSVDPTVTNEFFVLDPAGVDVMAGGPPSLPVSQFAALTPPLPYHSGKMTIDSISSITPGENAITVAGSGTYKELFTFDISFEYTFGLTPSTQEPDPTQLVNVTTINLSVHGDHPSWYGWLINLFTDALLAFFGPSDGPIQAAVAGIIDRAISDRLSSTKGGSGTTAAVQSVSISPKTGLSLQTWASVPVGDVCPGAAGSGAQFRPLAQIQHLQAIRDGLLAGTPEGSAYVALLAHQGPALMHLLAHHPELVAGLDRAVDLVLADFPAGNPAAGTLSAGAAAAVGAALGAMEEAAPPALARALGVVRGELPRFAGQPAAAVLARSGAGFRRLD